jgi:hypothetical protein
MDGIAYIGSNDGRVYAVGGDPNARLTVEVLPESDILQGGRVMGITFFIKYRGLPLEGAYIKFSVTQGELSQSGASTFPDGSQRIKYQAPDVTSDTTVRIDALATFFGVEDGTGSANITVTPASDYVVSSESAFNIWNYSLYIGLISFLIVANVVIVLMVRKGGGR